MQALFKGLAGCVLSASLALVATEARGADTPEGGGPGRNCFFSTQWRGWSSPAPDVLYLKVGLRDVYRVDLAGKAYGLRSPGAFLVSVVRGSNLICSAIDLDLAVSDHHGFTTHLFPRSITRLTAEEIAAIPPKDRP